MSSNATVYIDFIGRTQDISARVALIERLLRGLGVRLSGIAKTAASAFGVLYSVFQKVEEVLDRIKDKIYEISKGSAFALAGFITSLELMAREGEKDDKALVKLRVTLKNTGDAAGFSAAELEKTAQALTKVSTFSDDAIVGVEAILASFKNIKGDNFTQATKAVLDLATFMDSDATDAAKSLGRALADPERGLIALTRAGIVFTEQEREQIKAMSDSGNILSAQALILAKLEGIIGGMAAAAADTAGGSLKRLHIALGEVAEAIGKVITPALVSWTKATVDLLAPVQALAEAHKGLTIALTGATLWILLIGSAVGPVVKVVSAIITLTKWVGIAAVVFAKLGPILQAHGITLLSLSGLYKLAAGGISLMAAAAVKLSAALVAVALNPFVIALVAVAGALLIAYSAMKRASEGLREMEEASKRSAVALRELREAMAAGGKNPNLDDLTNRAAKQRQEIDDLRDQLKALDKLKEDNTFDPFDLGTYGNALNDLASRADAAYDTLSLSLAEHEKQLGETEAAIKSMTDAQAAADPNVEKRNQQYLETIGNLAEERDQLGMNAVALAVYNAQLQHLSEAQVENVRRIAQEKQDKEDLIALNKELGDSYAAAFDEYRAALQGISTGDLRLQDLSQAGGEGGETAERALEFKRMAKEIEDARKESEEADKKKKQTEEDRIKALVREGEELHKQLRTKQEIRAEEEARIALLLKEDKISEEDARRARAKLDEGEERKSIGFESVSGALNRIAEAAAGRQADPGFIVAANTAKIAEQTKAHAEKQKEVPSLLERIVGAIEGQPRNLGVI